jgi:hypothetical protein
MHPGGLPDCSNVPVCEIVENGLIWSAEISGSFSVQGKGVDVDMGSGPSPSPGTIMPPRVEISQVKPRIATTANAMNAKDVATFMICLFFILSLICLSVLVDKGWLKTECCM